MTTSQPLKNKLQNQSFIDAKQLNNAVSQRAVLRALQVANGWITDERIGERVEINERAVRLIIRDLRREGYPIASESGRGFKWALDDPEAMKATIADFRSRANDLFETADAMETELYRELGGKKSAAQISAGQKALL